MVIMKVIATMKMIHNTYTIESDHCSAMKLMSDPALLEALKVLEQRICDIQERNLSQ